MLNSNCPKVFFVVPLGATIERPDEDDIDTEFNEVHLFYGISQTDVTDMSWRYVTTTLLDSGSCQEHIKFVFF